jgi:predicted AlkP superfamily pyrophosphatase or phosphodiesterase
MVSVDGLASFYLTDPKAEMPTIRALAAAGAQASSMKASTPTVTWPNHTTLVTGVSPARHGVVGNNFFDRATGKRVALIFDPVYDKDQIVKVPTIYDLAQAAGLRTAAIRWPATRNAHTLDWTMPNVGTLDLLLKYTTPALQAECRIIPISLASDDLTTRVFNFVLREHRPNLALLHLLSVDHTQHEHGPRSPEAYAAIKAADETVRKVWEELKRDYPEQATLLVVSDHGFSPINRIILPNVILRQAGLLRPVGGNTTNSPIQIVVQGGAAFVYLLEHVSQPDLVDRIEKAFDGVRGVSKVVRPEHLQDYGVANPKDDPHAPDMLLFAEEGCAFGDTASGDLPFNEKPERKGTHGHDASLPNLHATFIAWGAGIKAGAHLGEISNLSVAPTLAKLLRIRMPNVEGAPLSAALSD